MKLKNILNIIKELDSGIKIEILHDNRVELNFSNAEMYKDNPVPSLDNIKCPRVMMRVACDKCNYPISEAKFPDEGYFGQILPHIPCKHELLQNGIETNNEQPECNICKEEIPSDFNGICNVCYYKG